jgi:hypothetical protein
MKKLVLSALLFAGLSQAAGCIIVADDTTSTCASDPNASICTGNVSATWSLKSSDAGGNVIAAACPSGGTTVRIFSQHGTDAPYTDDFTCAAGTGVATQLPVGDYLVWMQITDSTTTQKFAESAAQPVIVTDAGTTPLAITTFTDRAFFQASWQLTRAGSNTTCANVNADKMSVLATVSGGSNFFDDDSNRCVDGEGKTAFTGTPVPIGATYTVVVAALNTGGVSIGDSAALVQQPLSYGNQYLNLNTVTVPIN